MKHQIEESKLIEALEGATVEGQIAGIEVIQQYIVECPGLSGQDVLDFTNTMIKGLKLLKKD